MAKVVFGEFSAFTTKNNLVRYQKHNKLVSEKVIPVEVVAYLNKQLGLPPKPEQKFPRPSEEERARLREESLKVKPELQVEEPQAPVVPAPVDTTPAEEPLTSADFDLPDVTDEEIEAVASQIPESVLADQPTPTEDLVPGADFLEQVSIHTASITDIAEALYNRFGVYTVYLGQLPNSDELNPLTGENFSKYHLGIAYQAAIYAKNKGVLSRPPETGRKVLDAGREAHQNFQVDPVAQTMGDARRMNTFDYRTSVEGTQVNPTTEIAHEKGEDGQLHAVRRDIPEGQTGEFNGARAKFDRDEDQLLVQPNFSGKPVIRPNW